MAVYLVTDVAASHAAGHTVPEVVAAAVRAGVRTVQVRAKHADGSRFLAEVAEVARAITSVAPVGDVALIINDRADVALAARAAGVEVAGVHLGQSDLPAGLVRSLLWPGAVVGVSVGGSAELAAAERVADYVGLSPLHATATKPDAGPGLGLAGAAELAASSRVPAVAIGGITVDDLPGLRAAGLAGAAVVTGICSAPDPGGAATAYLAQWHARSTA
ncbi:thiamine phosphate synthase [Cellulomonas soli]